MSQHASYHVTRLRLEYLEDRCTPSALLGDPSVQLLAHHRRPHITAAVARAGVNQTHAVPIRFTLQCTGDASSMRLRSRGFTTQMGPWIGRGRIDDIMNDPVTNRVVITGATTIVNAKGEKLYVTLTTVWNPSTRLSGETVKFVGGTGRFAGASGQATLACTLTVLRPTPLKLMCDCKGSGTLILTRR